MRARFSRTSVVVLLALAIAVGVGQVYAKKPNHWTGPCPTPEDCDCKIFLYAPVICHGDCVYANICLARCVGATGCRPLPLE
jgi:hypothetical protein